MDKDELLKMLGLDKPLKKSGPDPLKIDKDVSKREEYLPDNTELSPTVLSLTEYELGQGNKLLKQWQKDVGMDSNTLADFFGCAFKYSPEIIEHHADKLRGKFIQSLFDTADYKTLHDMSSGNTIISRMTTESFAKQYKEVLDQHRAHQLHQKESGTGTWRKKKNPELEEKMMVAAAASQAVEEAAEEAEFMIECFTALGKEPGNPTGSMPLESVVNMFNRIKESDQLKRICELAGAYRRVAMAKQKMKTKHGYDDMVGIKLSGEVDHILTEELAQLVDVDLEMEFLLRLVDGECLAHEYHGTEPAGKGPVVVCMDGSGSMSGDPICQAKAFALAMSRIARHQKRDCLLVEFSNANDCKAVHIPAHKTNELELLEWLEHFFAGGTDLYIPLVKVPMDWNRLGFKKGKVDFFVLTDGQVDLPFVYKQSFEAFKAEFKVKLYTIAIGAFDVGPIKFVSDEVYNVKEISLQQEGIQKCFTI